MPPVLISTSMYVTLQNVTRVPTLPGQIYRLRDTGIEIPLGAATVR